MSPRAYEFSYSTCQADTAQRFRFVIAESCGFEKLTGRDRLGAETWHCHYFGEHEIEDVTAAVVSVVEAALASAEVESMRAQLSDAARAIDLATDSIIRLTGERDEAVADRARLGSELAAARREIVDLGDQLQSGAASMMSAAETIERLAMERDNLAARLAECVQTLERSAGVADDMAAQSVSKAERARWEGRAEAMAQAAQVVNGGPVERPADQAPHSVRQAMRDAGIEGWDDGSGKSIADAIRELAAELDKARADRFDAAARLSAIFDLCERGIAAAKRRQREGLLSDQERGWWDAFAEVQELLCNTSKGCADHPSDMGPRLGSALISIARARGQTDEHVAIYVRDLEGSAAKASSGDWAPSVRGVRASIDYVEPKGDSAAGLVERLLEMVGLGVCRANDPGEGFVRQVATIDGAPLGRAAGGLSSPGSEAEAYAAAMSRIERVASAVSDMLEGQWRTIEPGDDKVPDCADAWRGDGMPEIGDYVQVRTAGGHVYEGDVVATGGEDDEVRLNGPKSSPIGLSLWSTWSGLGNSADSLRTGWRPAKRPEPAQPSDAAPVPVEALASVEPDGDRWETSGTPHVGERVQVKLENGDIYEGQVVATRPSGMICLRGLCAVPSDLRSAGVRDWSTRPDSAPPHNRVGWRYVFTHTEPDDERLPDGWTWDPDELATAVGPEFIDSEGDTVDRMVYVSRRRLTVEFQEGSDSEPLAVVRAVIARHDRLARERGEVKP